MNKEAKGKSKILFNVGLSLFLFGSLVFAFGPGGIQLTSPWQFFGLLIYPGLIIMLIAGINYFKKGPVEGEVVEEKK